MCVNCFIQICKSISLSICYSLSLFKKHTYDDLLEMNKILNFFIIQERIVEFTRTHVVTPFKVNVLWKDKWLEFYVHFTHFSKLNIFILFLNPGHVLT